MAEPPRDKWAYFENNPARAGLIARAADGPFYLDFMERDGKLTACVTALQFTSAVE
jgi:hypothetical protein